VPTGWDALGQTCITPSANGWGSQVEDVFVYSVSPLNLMSTILDEKSFGQLTDWIGKVCSFTVLYKAALNGCSARLFHSLCDNQGPTITVVSTRSGRVFGGYTSESWAGVDYKAAPRSFLFLMYSSHGKYTPAVFPAKQNNNNTICRHPALGPTFGGGYDLSINLDDMPASSSNLGVSFDLPSGMQGQTALAGSYNTWGGEVVDIEVIQVYETEIPPELKQQAKPKPPPKPQPKVKPTPVTPPKTNTALPTSNVQPVKLPIPDWASLWKDIDFLFKYKPRYGEELSVTSTNVLLVGGVNSGKSSFVNSAYSTVSNHVEFVAPVTGGNDPTTLDYERYPLLDLNVELRDMWGWGDKGIDTNQIEWLLDGKVPNKTKKTELNPRFNGLQKDVSLGDSAHAVIVFVPASAITSGFAAYWTRFEPLLKIARTKDMQVVVVISMSDLLDDSCKGHAEKVYESNAVAQAVAQIHHVTGLPPNTIFPLVNYFWNDTGKSMIIEKMVAMILIRVLEQADGMFLRRFNQQRLGGKPKQSPTGIKRDDVVEAKDKIQALSIADQVPTDTEPKRQKFRLTLFVRAEEETGDTFEEIEIIRPTLNELKKKICEKFAPRLPDMILSIKKLSGENKNTKVLIADDEAVSKLRDETSIEVEFRTERW
jgi:hypothetical protein